MTSRASRASLLICGSLLLVGCGIVQEDRDRGNGDLDPTLSGGSGQAGGEGGGSSTGGVSSTGGSSGGETGTDPNLKTCQALSEDLSRDFWARLPSDQGSCSGDEPCDAVAPEGARCFGRCGWKDSSVWNDLATEICQDFYDEGCTDSDILRPLCVK